MTWLSCKIQVQSLVTPTIFIYLFIPIYLLNAASYVIFTIKLLDAKR